MLKLFSRSTDAPTPDAAPIELGSLELPSFPQITMAALEKARDVDSSLSELADLLAADPGVSVRIMKTVNSAAFARRNPVRNIHHAVTLLGRNEIESILIAVAVKGALPTKAVPGFDPARFWAASARRAVVSRAFSARIDPSHRSEAFTAGLLQDMAVPILADQLGDPYGAVLAEWRDGERDLAHQERLTFDWDHASIGALISERWGFPAILTDAIGAHHGTDEGRHIPLAAVSLVSTLREPGEGAGVDRLVQVAQDLHDFDPDETTEILDQCEAQAAEIAQLLG